MKELIMALGPVQMEKDIRDLGAVQVPYPRTPEFSSWYAGINEDLQYLFQTQRPVFTVACSGTGAMQMAADNLCAAGDTALTFATGTFGKRWGNILRAAGVTVVETPMTAGTNVTPEILAPLLQQHPEAKTVFLTYNETSTTALADVKGCAALLRGTDKLLVVDAVSALLAEPLHMDDWGVDVVVSSSQKALALPPGLGFIAFSERAWERVSARPCRSFYFDARPFLQDWGRGQLPFTSSLAIILQLKERLERIRKEGLSELQARHQAITDRLREGLRAQGFSFLSSHMGNCTTAACVPDDIDATEFVEKMRREKAVVLVPPYKGTNVFRIGNFGDISSDDVDLCLARIAEALQELRGSGRA